MVEPWTAEQRKAITDKLQIAGETIIDEMGASHVMIIACFRDGQHLHMLDVGNPPMPPAKLYTALAQMHEMSEAGHEGHVQ